jgi:hypothetical protein
MGRGLALRACGAELSPALHRSGPIVGRRLDKPRRSLSRYVGNPLQSSALVGGARFSPVRARPQLLAFVPFFTERDMPDTELMSFANELRTRAEEILTRAAGADDPEVQGMMRVVAVSYQKLARRVEQRVRQTRTA